MGVWTQNLSASSQVPLLVIGGVVEGAVLGLAQALVLRRVVPGFKVPAWVGAAAAAAGFEWLLGMLPSTTHSVWSTWPPAWIVVVGTALGSVLLASIGTAQAMVMPPDTVKACTWIGWTALGWCAGLTAFTLVAPPLWHEGQARWALVLTAVAGGTAMAFVMAAVTGIGVLRLRRRAVARGQDSDHFAGSRTLSSLLGTPVFNGRGDLVGSVSDLVVDLAAGLDRVPVTGVVLSRRGEPDRVVAWESLAERDGRPGLALTHLRADGGSAPGPTEVLARRDILDSPVVLADPPRRARVSDVVLELDPGHASVTGLDTSTARALRRLLGQAPLDPDTDPVPLSLVHLVSRNAHRAQLAVSVAHARDILEVADRNVLDKELPMLHPHVRGRVTSSDPVPRRTRRLAGWRLRRPRPGTGSGPELSE